MNALIDNIECTIDKECYRIGKDLDDRTCRVSYHSGILNFLSDRCDNFKLITNGHVYILNYNKDTYKPKNALTFTQYIELKKLGKPYL